MTTHRPFRASFDAPLLLPRGERPIPLYQLRGLKPHLYEHSSLKALALCSWRFPCSRPICPWCAQRKAQAARRDLFSLIDTDAPSLFVRLSAESDHDLDSAWSALAAVRAQFGKRSWLSSKSTSWIRSTEVTHTEQGWNLHDNIQVFGTPEQLAELKDTIVDRWLKAASAVQVPAAAPAQYAQPSRSTAAVLHYIEKGLCDYAADPSQGRTPGNLLHDWYVHDDALAGELWGEVETFVADHPRQLLWTARGGNLRGVKRDFDLTA